MAPQSTRSSAVESCWTRTRTQTRDWAATKGWRAASFDCWTAQSVYKIEIIIITAPKWAASDLSTAIFSPSHSLSCQTMLTTTTTTGRGGGRTQREPERQTVWALGKLRLDQCSGALSWTILACVKPSTNCVTVSREGRPTARSSIARTGRPGPEWIGAEIHTTRKGKKE